MKLHHGARRRSLHMHQTDNVGTIINTILHHIFGLKIIIKSIWVLPLRAEIYLCHHAFPILIVVIVVNTIAQTEILGTKVKMIHDRRACYFPGICARQVRHLWIRFIHVTFSYVFFCNQHKHTQKYTYT